MRFKAIVFDLDGTILDILDRDAFARYQALKDLSYDVSLEDIKKHYRHGMGMNGVTEKLGIRMTEEETRKYIEFGFAYFMKKEASQLTRIHDGAREVLCALHAKYKLVVVTSRDTLSSVEEDLERFDVRKFFTLIVTREVAAKYHGVEEIPLLPFQEQRTKLYKCAIGLTQIMPEDILCIGDSVSELEPAQELGMKTIGVLTGFSSKENMLASHITTIQDITQLKRVLKTRQA
jgi:phosphoglycolate phosphatase-like HAD superfamily hydrolase